MFRPCKRPHSYVLTRTKQSTGRASASSFARSAAPAPKLSRRPCLLQLLQLELVCLQLLLQRRNLSIPKELHLPENLAGGRTEQTRWAAAGGRQRRRQGGECARLSGAMLELQRDRPCSDLTSLIALMSPTRPRDIVRSSGRPGGGVWHFKQL